MKLGGVVLHGDIHPNNCSNCMGGDRDGYRDQNCYM